MSRKAARAAVGPSAPRAAETPGETWHSEVPGARWFRADLHVHTFDDAPCGRIKCSTSGPATPSTWEAYAYELLNTAVSRGVEVIGLTPHAPYSHSDETLSASWRIVDVWGSGKDTGGVPFRDKIYAVFPGFEASMADGARGVHLLFLFDREIGREAYVRAFHAVMGGIDPWDGDRLRNSALPARDAFQALQAIVTESKASPWHWLCLAPHAFQSERGLFGQLKSQMLQNFPHEYLAALELGDHQLPEDAHEGREWLAPGMRRYHHALFHASDAYVLNPDSTSVALDELGSRTSLVKLAKPSIEALRQAFLASDSRLRLTLDRNSEGALVAGVGPDPLARDRPWLRQLTVTGGTSFFGGQTDGGPRTVTFRLNPDLTCVIGGRMTGKSTLLDGMRVHYQFALPTEDYIRSEVEGRGRDRFLSGGPTVTEEISGPFPTTDPVRTRWPAVFFTQRELQRAAVEQAGLRQLLFHTSADKQDALELQWAKFQELTYTMQLLLPRISGLRSELAEAQQELASSNLAKAAMERWEQAGAARLSEAQADVGQLRTLADAIRAARTSAEAVAGAVTRLAMPEIRSERIAQSQNQVERDSVQESIATARKSGEDLVAALGSAANSAEGLHRESTRAASDLSDEIQAALAEAGGSPDELNQFAALSERAGRFEEHRLRAESLSQQFDGLQRRFDDALEQRRETQDIHRGEMNRTLASIGDRFGGLIVAKAIENGIQDDLEGWITGLRERGITRWWNERGELPPLSGQDLLNALDADQLGSLGMSPAVAATFRDVMTDDRRRQLQAVPSPDRYELALQVAESEYRPMHQLSGGQQVSLLLSILLEAEDDRPLVVDQPEEELDKAYLFDTVLPALRRLKGRRQIVFVTHDANIVVNGDADQVIHLAATSDSGWVAAQGAIEDSDVRGAILQTLDGGETAFEMRALKYGF